MRTRRTYAMFGLLATLVGMAAGHLVAAITTLSASPVLAVGSTVITLTPTPLKEWAIAHFGSNDKLVLVGSVVIVVLILAAVAGVLALRRLAVGVALLVALVALAGAAALTNSGAGILDVVPSLVTAVVGVAALVGLDRLAKRAGDPATTDRGTVGTEATAGTSRRGVLLGSGAVLVLAAVMGGAGRVISGIRSGLDVALPSPTKPAPPLPTGLEAMYPDITPLQVPIESFYRVDTRLDVPIIDQNSWTLTIDGDVDQEVTFTFDDLTNMELVEKDITLTCVSNSVGGEFVGGARWLGIPLKTLLDQAGISNTKADQILSTDVDGMTISTPLDLATDGRDAILAIGMNGVVLPREHGFPARMVIPGLYGFISATKWVERITLTTYADQKAYWTDRDWATDAPIKISSRIDTPRSLAQLKAGKNIVGGVAWAQTKGGVAKVEVQIDGGSWQEAQLGPDVNTDYWRQWFYEWDAKSGSRSVAARVTDGEGNVQTAARANPFPDGASGVQSLQVTVA